MNTKLASSTSMVTAPWKFFLLLATLLFSYALTVHADDHAEEAAVEGLPALRELFQDGVCSQVL